MILKTFNVIETWLMDGQVSDEKVIIHSFDNRIDAIAYFDKTVMVYVNKHEIDDVETPWRITAINKNEFIDTEENYSIKMIESVVE